MLRTTSQLISQSIMDAKIVLIVCGLLGACSALPSRRDVVRSGAVAPHIVDGVMADIKELPYQLSMEMFLMHMCGASIVSEQYAVTAAHCISGFPAWMLRVRAGSTWTHMFNWRGSTSGVETAVAHPRYNEANVDYDVGVLKLKDAFPFSQTIQPIALPAVDEDTGAVGTASGWGTLSEGFPITAYKLRKVDVPILSKSVCKKLMSREYSITDRMICAGDAHGDSCQGDSGGPLAAEGKLIGIVSWGIGCNRPNLPGIYTRVSNSEIRLFITNQTGI